MLTVTVVVAACRCTRKTEDWRLSDTQTGSIHYGCHQDPSRQRAFIGPAHVPLLKKEWRRQTSIIVTMKLEHQLVHHRQVRL